MKLTYLAGFRFAAGHLPFMKSHAVRDLIRDYRIFPPQDDYHRGQADAYLAAFGY